MTPAAKAATESRRKLNDRASVAPPVKCPHCGNEEHALLEQTDHYVFCAVCGRTWRPGK